MSEYYLNIPLKHVGLICKTDSTMWLLDVPSHDPYLFKADMGITGTSDFIIKPTRGS